MKTTSKYESIYVTIMFSAAIIFWLVLMVYIATWKPHTAHNSFTSTVSTPENTKSYQVVSDPDNHCKRFVPGRTFWLNCMNKNYGIDNTRDAYQDLRRRYE